MTFCASGENCCSSGVTSVLVPSRRSLVAATTRAAFCPLRASASRAWATKTNIRGACDVTAGCCLGTVSWAMNKRESGRQHLLADELRQIEICVWRRLLVIGDRQSVKPLGDDLIRLRDSRGI